MITRSPVRMALNAAPTRRSGVFDECHAKPLAKLPARGRSMHVQRVEIGGAPEPVGLALDRVDEMAHDRGGLVRMRQRPTPLARTVGRERRLPGIGEKFTVLALGRSRRTGRRQKNAGRPHAHVEDALEIRVAPAQRRVTGVRVERHGDCPPFAITVYGRESIPCARIRAVNPDVLPFQNAAGSTRSLSQIFVTRGFEATGSRTPVWVRLMHLAIPARVVATSEIPARILATSPDCGDGARRFNQMAFWGGLGPIT
jgi:hypothetical protein